MRIPIPPAIKCAKKYVKVTTPKPPTWINARRIKRPCTDNTSVISTVESPVTHTALVLRKSASTQASGCTVACGVFSKSMPTRINATKLPMKSCPGVNLRLASRRFPRSALSPISAITVSWVPAR